MFMFHIAISLELLVLGFGVVFLIWALRNEGRGIGLAKIVGYILIILALLGVVCTIYQGVRVRSWMHQYKMCMQQQPSSMMASPNVNNGNTSPTSSQ